MTTTLTFQQRRAIIGRVVSSIASKRGALSDAELQSLRELNNEIEAIDGDIRSDEERKVDGAFSSWLRRGSITELNHENRALLERYDSLQRRDMGTSGQAAYPGVSGGAGIFIPMGFRRKVESAVAFYSRLFSLATVLDRDTGSPQGYPQDDDATVSGEMIPEAGQVNTGDVSLPAAAYLKAYKFSSKLVKCSIELVQDAGFPFDDYLADRLGIRIARAMNAKFTIGSGTNEPNGFVTSAAVGATAVGSSGNDGTSAGTNTIGTDDMSNLEESVDPAYRGPGAVFMMHPNTLAALRRVKDSKGMPAFAGLHSGGEDRILNYKVELNVSLDQLQSGPSSPPIARNTVCFGRFDKVVIQRAPMILYKMGERFAEFGQAAYLLLQRADGALIDGGGGAVKLLQNVY